VLSSDGDIYSFGCNRWGQLGVHNVSNRETPIKLDSNIKFIDIETSIFEDLSVALSENGKYYVWGNCNDQKVMTPTITSFESFHEVFVSYAKNISIFKPFHKNMFEKISNQQLFLQRIPYFDYVKNNFDTNILFMSSFFTFKKKALIVNNKEKVFESQTDKNFDSDFEVFTEIKDLSNEGVKNICQSGRHIIALTKKGNLYTWGINSSGQLGSGNTAKCFIPKTIINQKDYHIIDIACGYEHNIALTDNGHILAFGSNYFGAIGNGDKNGQMIPQKIEYVFPDKIISICCGSYHSMTLTKCGQVYSWGLNSSGQLGIDSFSNKLTPQSIDHLKGIAIKKIVCGPFYSLFLSDEGDVYACGDNSCGQLGIARKNDENRPCQIKVDVRFVDIYATHLEDLSIALSQNGRCYVWGTQLDDQVIYEPKQTTLSSIQDAIAVYSKQKLCSKVIHFEEIQIFKV